MKNVVKQLNIKIQSSLWFIKTTELRFYKKNKAVLRKQIISNKN